MITVKSCGFFSGKDTIDANFDNIGGPNAPDEGHLGATVSLVLRFMRILSQPIILMISHSLVPHGLSHLMTQPPLVMIRYNETNH